MDDPLSLGAAPSPTVDVGVPGLLESDGEVELFAEPLAAADSAAPAGVALEAAGSGLRALTRRSLLALTIRREITAHIKVCQRQTRPLHDEIMPNRLCIRTGFSQ